MKNPGIYILTNRVNRKQYVGRDRCLPKRSKIHLSGKAPMCRHVHKAIKKYGYDAFSVEIIEYPGISHEALNSVERWKISQLQTLTPCGYNLMDGGESGKHSEETRQKISEFNYKRVLDGTNPFLGGEVQKKRVDDGTHHLLGGEIQRRTNKKRVDDGTHHWLGDKNPVHKRVLDGTHNFLGDKNPVHKRVLDGTHNFLGDKNVQPNDLPKKGNITGQSNAEKPNGVISLRCLGSGMKFTTIPSNVALNSCLKRFPTCRMPNRNTCFSGSTRLPVI